MSNHLHHPNPERPFTVEVDASETRVGAVLSQNYGERPKLFPWFFSLKNTEQNYWTARAAGGPIGPGKMEAEGGLESEFGTLNLDLDIRWSPSF